MTNAEMLRELDTIHLNTMALKAFIYRQQVELMDDEELGHEWKDRTGDTMNEFSWIMFHRSRKFIEDKLCDQYETRLFDEYVK